ncbi:MAG: carboxypeptidase-like regulatory domain-containing protein [Planctomycetales bacterium]
MRGTLAYKGSPVAGAFLTFQSKDLDEPAFCWSDADGRFAAMTNDTIGIFPGEYVVTVSLPDGGIPQVYAEASSSPLRLRVESGSAQDFEIQLED